jgi:hypothetical protein
MKLIRNKYKILVVKHKRHHTSQCTHVYVGETIRMCQMHLAQCRMDWWAILNTVINLMLSYKTAFLGQLCVFSTGTIFHANLCSQWQIKLGPFITNDALNRKYWPKVIRCPRLVKRIKTSCILIFWVISPCSPADTP